MNEGDENLSTEELISLSLWELSQQSSPPPKSSPPDPSSPAPPIPDWFRNAYEHI